MSLSLTKEIQESSFLLVVMGEKEYLHRLAEIVRSVEKTGTKICYVCLNAPYTNIMDHFRLVGIDVRNFFFIDGVSRAGKSSDSRCRFVTAPPSAAEIESAIRDIVDKENCSVVVFDTLSSLLVYQDSFSVLHMTNNLQKKAQQAKKIFLVIKETRKDARFIKDLGMFADKVIDMRKP